MKYTLEQLEGMSDKQINEAILSLITGYPIDKAREIITAGYFNKSSFCDYCNSWADMGPLIFSEGISLINNGDFCEAGYGFESLAGMEGGGYSFINEAEHENPLRAAAIVYILAKQEEY